MATSPQVGAVALKIMKILLITDLYPPYHEGGYELRCEETVDELARRRHDVTVLTSKLGSVGAQNQRNVHRLLMFDGRSHAGVTAAVDPFRLRRRYNQIKWALKTRKNYRIARSFISATPPEVAFIWNMGYVGVGPILAAQDCGIPTVYSLGDYWLLRLKTELCDEAGYIKRRWRDAIAGLRHFSDLDLRHLLTVSMVLKQAYVASGFPEGQLHVVSRGLPSGLILPVSALPELPRISHGRTRLLFVGRMAPSKAPDVAISAIDVLRTQHGIADVELDIVGQGSQEYESLLERMVLDLKLETNVRFLGWLEHSAVLDLYSKYDALLFPSRWMEPFGGTVLEAMARGLPVIASRRGGPLEIIRDGENGLLVPADEPRALADAVLRLIESAELTQKIRVAGIETIYERYTLSKVVDQTLDYMQTVLAPGGG